MLNTMRIIALFISISTVAVIAFRLPYFIYSCYNISFSFHRNMNQTRRHIIQTYIYAVIYPGTADLINVSQVKYPGAADNVM